MKKTTLLLLGATALFVTAPFHNLKASATDTSSLDGSEFVPASSLLTKTRPLTKIRAFDMPDSDIRELKHIHTRPPFTVRNATDCPLTVTFTTRDKTEDYVWDIAPKDGGQTYYEKELLEGPNLTEDNRYGTLTVYQWREQAIGEDGCFIFKRYAVFGGLVDTSASFSIYPTRTCYYSLEPDETSGGTTAPKWLVEDVKKELAKTPSLFNQALEKLWIKCATMTPEEKEKPHTVGFPSCLHNPNFWLPPLPSSYLLRSAQTGDLRRQLHDFFPTDEEILAAEKAFMAEGIKIYHGANPFIRPFISRQKH